jgi:hypothetical protein
MFKLAKTITLDWPVRVSAPTNGGSVENHEFTGRFKILPNSEYQELMKTAKSDAEVIKQFLIGWEGLTDEDGNALDFDPAIIDELCEYPFIRNAIFRAYSEACAGAAVKN